MVLPVPSLPVFGTVHALRVELGNFVYLLRSYTRWGVSSMLSGLILSSVTLRIKRVWAAPSLGLSRLFQLVSWQIQAAS